MSSVARLEPISGQYLIDCWRQPLVPLPRKGRYDITAREPHIYRGPWSEALQHDSLADCRGFEKRQSIKRASRLFGTPSFKCNLRVNWWD